MRRDDNDIDTAGRDDRNRSSGYDADTVFAVSVIPGRAADAQIYSVSGQGLTGRRVWIAHHILPEERKFARR